MDVSQCAACGKGGDDLHLKKCAACKMVSYCGRECQLEHRPEHKTECKKRAAELFDEALFGPPSPREDCQICFLPLPLEANQSTYQPCCGKHLCTSCIVEHQRSRRDSTCPFCRTPPFASNRELRDRLSKRMKAGDPGAFYTLGNMYRNGRYGLQQDSRKAMELWLKAAELGSANAHSTLGYAYEIGVVEVDSAKSKYHYQMAAMKGDVVARHNLGASECRAGSISKGVKHLMISAKGGYNQSLVSLRDLFVDGYVAKDEFEAALRAHKDSQDEINSEQRKNLVATKGDFLAAHART